MRKNSFENRLYNQKMAAIGSVFLILRQGGIYLAFNQARMRHKAIL